MRTCDFEKMEEVRARVDTIVKDHETAKKLKAWYRQLCKRPCFHDAYLQAFNEPSTVLVDTDGKGVERITEKGFVVAGVEYEVDCIIYASGFEVGTDYGSRAGFEVIGRDGLTLSEAWADGMRSLHGIHVHGFPNAFFVQPTQGANLISNIPHNLTEAGRTIATIVSHALDHGMKEVEVEKAAQDAWIETLLRAPPPDDRRAGLHAGLLQQRGPAADPRHAPRRRLSGGAERLFQISRRMAVVGRVRRPRLPVSFGSPPPKWAADGFAVRPTGRPRRGPVTPSVRRPASPPWCVPSSGDPSARAHGRRRPRAAGSSSQIR